MPQLSYDEVNLMLRLYDMRREPRLRQARAWFIEHFHPVSPEEMMQKFPHGGEHCQSRFDRRRAVLREQWRNLGGVGSHARHRSDVAVRIQESSLVFQY